MLQREDALTHLDRLMRLFPAVAILGPRQAGKTTLAFQFARRHSPRAVYIDLELPSDRDKLADPELYFDTHRDRLVILDEIQRVPELFPVLRAIIDRRIRRGRRSRQFLILGSASLNLLQQTSETLAGRLAHFELPPFTIGEVAGHSSHAIDRLWVRGGFPRSFLAPTERDSVTWRNELIKTYLERDIPMLGPRIPAETLRRFWEMLAHNQGQTLNHARIAAGLGVSGQTVNRYLDLLVDLLLVRRLPPWTSNAAKRLVKSPKVYVRDSGLVHALLDIPGFERLLGHPVVGPSWEGFVIENIIATAPEGAEPHFYRTADGAEIDLLLTWGSRKPWAIEIKRSLSPQPAKGFHIACADVKPERRFVVYPGEERYPLDRNTEAVPLMQAGRGNLVLKRKRS